MSNHTKTTKIFAYLSLVFGSLWIGSYASRMLFSYQLFERKDFVLRTIFNEANLKVIMQVLYPVIILQITLYILFLVSFLVFSLTSKINVKNNGWFFIIIVIILATLPLELYLTTIDFRIVSEIYSNSFSVNEIIRLIVKRFKVFGSFSIIEILLYCAGYYFVLFKPLKKS